MPFETQGWEVANWPSHVWRGQHPRSVGVLQHLRSPGLDLSGSGVDGFSSRCEVVGALSNAHPLCGPVSMCWGECHRCPYFSAETLLRPSSTVSITCSTATFYTAVQTSAPRRQGVKGREAMSMRSTNGYGCLEWEGLIWGVCQCLEQRMALMQARVRRGHARATRTKEALSQVQPPKFSILPIT